MKLSNLHECVTTGGIAIGPMGPAFTTPKKRKKKKKIQEADEAKFGYMGITTQKEPTNKMTEVWTSFKSPKSKDSWEKIYAATNNPDERLLKQHRGKNL